MFLTIEDVQNDIVLSDNVWFDKTFYSVRSENIVRNESGGKLKGLSRNQICIGVATDKQYTVLFIEGTGKPTPKKTLELFQKHIKFGSTLIHDNESAHKKLITELSLQSVSYTSKFRLGLEMADNMKAELVCSSLQSAVKMNPAFRGAIFHSDRGSQYTSAIFRQTLDKFGVVQSMNSAGGRCHDNAKCESMWGRFKEEKLYKTDTSKMPMDDVKSLIWRYFYSYWNYRRICSAIGGIPPMTKRFLYFDSLLSASLRLIYYSHCVCKLFVLLVSTIIDNINVRAKAKINVL